ncbi:hypothetical protein Tco_1178348, partial [Tanacetum coccineum]
MTLLIARKVNIGLPPKKRFSLFISLVARLKVTRPYMTSLSSSIPVRFDNELYCSILWGILLATSSFPLVNLTIPSSRS